MNLIEELKRLSAVIGDKETHYLDDSDSVDVVNKAIAELQKREWISAKDKLPEETKLVLSRYEGVYDCRLCVFSEGHFGVPNEPDGKGSQPATHWMPLPLPPTGSDQ